MSGTTTTTISLPLLDSVRIATPCDARWEDMTGDERKRRCAACNLDVHNIAALTREEAEAVLGGLAQGRVCARFFRRVDGTIITRDCPIGLAEVRRAALRAAGRIAAALGLVVLAGAAARAAQDPNWGNFGWSMRLRNVEPVRWAVSKLPVRAQMGLVRTFRGRGIAGDVALPPGTAPNVLPVQFGPHEWEYRE